MMLVSLLVVLGAAPAVADAGAVDSKWAAEMKAMEDKAWADALQKYLPDGGRAMNPPFRWAMRNVVEDIDIPGVQESNGVPVKLHAVRVKNDLRGVLEEIVGSFEKQGLYIQPVDQQQQFTAETAVTALDVDRFISYTAIIRCERNGICSVVLGEANVGLAAAMRQFNKAKGTFAPVPPNATGMVTTSAEGMSSLAYSVPMGEAEVKKWYAAELPKLGFKALPDHRYKRGTEVVTVSTRRHEGTVTVLLIRRASLPNED